MKPYPNESLFMTVNGRCALPLDMLAQRLPGVEEGRALDALREHGFEFITVDPIATALEWVGRARYERGMPITMAPEVVDCSGFVKWVYGRLGVCLPRRSIQQSRLGSPVERPEGLQPGDLVFSPSRYNRQMPGDPLPVGHAGMYVGGGRVVHSTRECGGVEVIDADAFWKQGFAGARRVLPKRLLTALIPQDWFVERADDMVCAIYDILSE